MTWIKICGITNLEDALAAVDGGADALGFVFHDKSPRRVDARQVREIGEQIPRGLEKIGVFVMATEMEMKFVADEAQLTGWQLHRGVNGKALGDALRSESFFRHSSQSQTGKNVYVSVPANFIEDEEGCGGFGWSKVVDREISALFIDSGHGGLPGGTGQTFNWERLQQAIERLSGKFKVVVAGGLTPENVGVAIRVLHPWGVDVSSGVEAKPGKKDPEKIRAFVKAVREADKAGSNSWQPHPSRRGV